MKFVRLWSPIVVMVAIAVCWSLTKANSDEAPKAAEPAKPATTKIETGKLVVETTLKGTIEAEQTAELFLDARNFQGPFIVKTAAVHGTRVKKGDVILELDTTRIDQSIHDLKLERGLADLSLKLAREEMPILEQSLPLNLATAERHRQSAEEDFKRYTEVEREQTQKNSEFHFKSQQHYLDYAREELKQLQKMYRDKDLTEETEEIILKRQRDQIEQLEFNLESMKIHQDRESKLDRPRRDQSMKDHLVNQEIAWKKAQINLPLELNQKKIALEKQTVERARTEERFEQLQKDRNEMTVRAPMDGIVYHGQADRGQWNSAAVSGRLRPHGTVQPKEIFMTVVSPKELVLRTDVEEKEASQVREGQTGQATLAAFSNVKLPAKVKMIAMVPRTAGYFDTKISLEIPAKIDNVMAGMSATAKIETYRNDTATLAPTASIFSDDSSDEHYVYKASSGPPTKVVVEIGKASGGKTEILKGVKVGDEILVAKP